MIRYLEQREKGNCRRLWEEAFPEDSKEFDDYYFLEKMKDNRVLVKEIDGAIASMLHQNPYEVMLRDKKAKVDYIVGVATDRLKRKQGHMRALLCRMLEEMYGEGMPFCFLMPADERIYLPFDFAYIFDQPNWKLKPDVGTQRRKVPLNPAVDGDSPEDSRIDVERGVQRRKLASWLQNWLSENYQVYCVRDEDYLKRLELELKSEDGEWSSLYSGNQLCGMQCFWGNPKKEQRALLCDSFNREDGGAEKPAVMARIVHLESFMEHIRLKRGADRDSLVVWLQIEDKLISANHGVFCWTVKKDGSSIMRQEGQPQLELTISQLTQWLFGYKELKDAPDWCDQIEVLKGVFLDEIV